MAIMWTFDYELLFLADIGISRYQIIVEYKKQERKTMNWIPIHKQT